MGDRNENAGEAEDRFGDPTSTWPAGCGTDAVRFPFGGPRLIYYYF